MTTTTTPLQQLPPWMSWVPVTVTVSGGYSISYSITNLPLTYYGPSIPLGTAGPWTWGGLTSPAPTTTTTSISSSFSPLTTTSATAKPSSTTTIVPPSTLTSSFSTAFPSSSSIPHTVTSPSTNPPSGSSATSPTVFSSASSSTFASTSSTAPLQHHQHLSPGALAGVVVGSVVGGLAFLAFFSMCLWLNLGRRRQSQPAPRQVTGDSSFGGDIEDHGEWQIVVPRSSEPSGGSVAAGSGVRDASTQGSHISHHATIRTGEALAEPSAETAGAHNVLYPDTPNSSGPTGHTRRLTWTPWQRGSARPYQDVPTSEDTAPNAVEGQGAVSPPMSPRSVQYSDGHNSDAEQESLLRTAPVSSAAVAATSVASEGSNLASSSEKSRFVERAREAVVQRNARQRASYVPGAAGFFTWFRSSWASSWRGARAPSPNNDELGFRPQSEKSAPGSKLSSNRSVHRGLTRSQRSRQSSAKSAPIPEHDGDESPPTPHSSQFPIPPPTHLEARVQSRSLASSVDPQYRSVSACSAGRGSLSSGNTVYHDALDAPPLPSIASSQGPQNSLETSVRLVPRPSPTNRNTATEMGELAERSSGSSELMPPPPIRDIQPHPFLTRPLTSLHSLQSSLRSLAYQADDVLDEPPPLPSASLDRRSYRGPVSSSPPPSYTDWHHLPPPGLEDYNYNRVQAFDRSESRTTRTTSGLVDVLEEEPPSAGSQWRRIASGDDLVPVEDRITPPMRVTTHFRPSSTLEYFNRGVLTSPRAGSVHSAPLLSRSAPTSVSGRGMSTRAPSSADVRRGTSLISRSSSRSHSPWSRLSRGGYSLPGTDGLTRMPSLSAFGGRSSPPPLDEYAGGETLQRPDTPPTPDATCYGYAV